VCDFQVSVTWQRIAPLARGFAANAKTGWILVRKPDHNAYLSHQANLRKRIKLIEPETCTYRQMSWFWHRLAVQLGHKPMSRAKLQLFSANFFSACS